MNAEIVAEGQVELAERDAPRVNHDIPGIGQLFLAAIDAKKVSALREGGTQRVDTAPQGPKLPCARYLPEGKKARLPGKF